MKELKSIYQIRFTEKKMFGYGLDIPEDGCYFESEVDAAIAMKLIYDRIKKSIKESGRKITGWSQKYKETDGVDTISFYDQELTANFNTTKIYGQIFEYNLHPAGWCQRKYSISWEISEKPNEVKWGSKDLEIKAWSDHESAIKEFDAAREELIERFKAYDNKILKTTQTFEEYEFTNMRGEQVSVIKEIEVFFKDGVSFKIQLLLH